MSENYIVINGKRAELTEEQLRQLGIEVSKANPFARARKNGTYYYIDTVGKVIQYFKEMMKIDTLQYNTANYCTDKGIMEQRALHETLNRLLWRYSMEHEGDKINWDNTYTNKFVIDYSHNHNTFCVDVWHVSQPIGVVYFNTKETAENAIKEIIEPFMAAHPNFKW